MSNGMTNWKGIGCHNPVPHEHNTLTIEVDLSERHGYLDYAPIPERLWVPPFRMEVWDWTAAPPYVEAEEELWCPASDVVSETIAELGIWEPPETLAMLNLFETTRFNDQVWHFLDIGAQLGWYSMLALDYGLFPITVEADQLVADVLKRNLTYMTDKFGMADVYEPNVGVFRVDPFLTPVRFGGPLIVKIDIEGAEMTAIEWLRPTFETGEVRAALIETTPHFSENWHWISKTMMDEYGFVARLLPDKADPPVRFDQLADLETSHDPLYVNDVAVARGQINVLYMQPDFPVYV